MNGTTKFRPILKDVFSRRRTVARAKRQPVRGCSAADTALIRDHYSAVSPSLQADKSRVGGASI